MLSHNHIRYHFLYADSPRGNGICRMVDASEVAFAAVFPAPEKAWTVSGELLSASGGAGRSVYY
jgi:hypothetical protein